MPTAWPPEAGVVGDHFRRHVTVYVLAGVALTAALGAATLWHVLALRHERGAAERLKLAEEER